MTTVYCTNESCPQCGKPQQDDGAGVWPRCTECHEVASDDAPSSDEVTIKEVDEHDLPTSPRPPVLSSPGGTCHPLMLTDVPWSEIERAQARLASLRSSTGSVRLVRERYDRPKICEFEQLLDQPTKGLWVKPKAKFTMTPVVTKLKKAVGYVDSDEGWAPLALKYSACFADGGDGGGHTFMIGWDHAMVLLKGHDGWYAHAIYSGNYSEGNRDTHAFFVSEDRAESLHLNPPAVKMVLPGKVHTWRKFDLSSRNLKVSKLVTFSLTSCSFACLFDEDAEMVIVSHMSTAAIPVAWLAATELGIRGRALKMLVSLHGDPDERDKYTKLRRFPCAGDNDISATLCSRGPVTLELKRGGDTPSLTHPYIGLDFTGGTLTCFSALGYNNDPTMKAREMPPFHAIWSERSGKLMQTKDTAFVFETFEMLVRGDFGFGYLHLLLLSKIAEADRAYAKEKGSPFKSTVLTALLSQAQSSKGYLARKMGKGLEPPKGLEWAERAMCLVVDLALHATNPKYEWLLDALFDAWSEFQTAYVFDLDKLGEWS